MRAWVAVTDKDWYRFLSRRSDFDELNFWQPGWNREFHTLSPGEPFLFKLHYPDKAIVGGGFFTHSSRVPTSVASFARIRFAHRADASTPRGATAIICLHPGAGGIILGT